MEERRLIARLAQLREEMFSRAVRGDEMGSRETTFRAAAECILDGDLGTAQWILASGRVERRAVFASRRIVPIAVVRAMLKKKASGR